MKIFFDLDGTLTDISERHYEVYTEVVGKFDGKPVAKDAYWKLKRQKTKWPELLTMSGVPAEAEPQFLAEFIKRIESVEYLKIDTLQPQALATLKRLSGSHECYLVSLRRNRQHLLEQLGWLGLSPYFTEILSGHSEHDGYDVKIPLLQAKVGSQKGVIIGDTEADVVTGKQLGFTTVAVTSGIRDPQFLSALQPDYLVDDIAAAASLEIY